jgi:hypothetical protein
MQNNKSRILNQLDSSLKCILNNTQTKSDILSFRSDFRGLSEANDTKGGQDLWN